MVKTLIFSALLLTNTSYGLEPLRTDKIGGSLGDIDCRMKGFPGYPWTRYRDSDKATWAHEGTHSINARIRNEFNVDNGYYLLNGEFVALSNPDFKLSDIAKKVNNKNHKLYHYLTKKDWENKPLYVVDELSAYVNAAIVSMENEMYKRARECYENGLKMYEYSLIAYNMCRQSDYKEKQKFYELLTKLRQRLMYIGNELSSD